MKVIERSITPASEMTVILGALTALRKGDASVRLPLNWVGVRAGRRRVQRRRRAERTMARSWSGCASSARKASSASAHRSATSPASGASRSMRSTTLIDDLVHPTSETARVIGAVAQGDLSQTMALEVDGAAAPGRVPAHRARPSTRWSISSARSPSEVTRVAREVGTEGKLGGQAKVQGRRRHLEGPDRQRQLDGRQPDRPGAQHRRRDDRGRQRRPVEEDHRRRQGRDPRAEEHDQHDGRPAALVRVRSDARGARGRHRRQARRPGRRRGRLRHVEGPDRQRQLRWPAT